MLLQRKSHRTADGPDESRAGRVGFATFLAATTASLVVMMAVATSAAGPADAATPTDGTFVPIAPCRLIDTRTGGDAASLATGATGLVQVAGASAGDCAGKIPAAGDVSAAVLNVTAIPFPGSLGYLTVYPADQPKPDSSNVNYHAGEIIPDLVTATMSATPATAGQIDVYNGGTGRLHYIVDVEGYYLHGGSTQPAGSLYHPIAPCRLVDTRTASGGAGPLAAQATRTVLVADVASGDCNGKVPAGASAVTVNTTAVADKTHDSYGYLTVYPADADTPGSSNLDFSTGETIPNLAQTKLSADGHVTVLNGAVGNVDFILDIQGYYTSPGAAGGLKYTPLAPGRVLDTRPDQSGLDPDADTLVMDFTQPEGDLPAGTAAIVWNVTAVPDTTNPSFGYLTLYPDSDTVPATSNLDFDTGQYISNMVISGLSADGSVDITSGAVGYVDVVADLQGTFSTP